MRTKRELLNDFFLNIVICLLLRDLIKPQTYKRPINTNLIIFLGKTIVNLEQNDDIYFIKQKCRCQGNIGESIIL